MRSGDNSDLGKESVAVLLCQQEWATLSRLRQHCCTWTQCIIVLQGYWWLKLLITNWNHGWQCVCRRPARQLLAWVTSGGFHSRSDGACCRRRWILLLSMCSRLLFILYFEDSAFACTWALIRLCVFVEHALLPIEVCRHILFIQSNSSNYQYTSTVSHVRMMSHSSAMYHA